MFTKSLRVVHSSNDDGVYECFPDSKVHGANMGPIWGGQDPGGPHDGPINFAIWVVYDWNMFKKAEISYNVRINLCFCKNRFVLRN